MTPVEVATPDQRSARALRDDAVIRHFHVELVEAKGRGTVVRLRPAPTAAAGWVFELLALVERWLHDHNLEVANVRHGKRSYVITSVAPGKESDGGPRTPAAA